MTDTAYLAAVLSDGCWHSHTEILERSFANRGCGLTVHSRAADLRKRGHVVETRLERDGRGRTLSFYRLVVLEEAVDSVADVRDVTRSAAVSSSTPSTSEREAPSPRSPRLAPVSKPNEGGVLVFDAHDQATLFGDAA